MELWRSPEPEWFMVCATDGSSVPAMEFIHGVRDRKRQALMMRRLQFLLELTQAQAPDEVRRPHVGLVDGAIKEYRHLGDRQLRILFSWEREGNTVLLLNGTRKKTKALDSTVIERAIVLRELWVRGQLPIPLDFTHLEG